MKSSVYNTKHLCHQIKNKAITEHLFIIFVNEFVF